VQVQGLGVRPRIRQATGASLLLRGGPLRTATILAPQLRPTHPATFASLPSLAKHNWLVVPRRCGRGGVCQSLWGAHVGRGTKACGRATSWDGSSHPWRARTLAPATGFQGLPGGRSRGAPRRGTRRALRFRLRTLPVAAADLPRPCPSALAWVTSQNPFYMPGEPPSSGPPRPRASAACALPSALCGPEGPAWHQPHLRRLSRTTGGRAPLWHAQPQGPRRAAPRPAAPARPSAHRPRSVCVPGPAGGW
jgi:hypothetical protein